MQLVKGPPGPLNPSQIFRDRGVFLLGSTGFLGKVVLSMLLDRFPDVGRVYVMVRRGSGTDSETRFWKSVVTSPPFDPLRARLGGPEKLAAFIAEKCRVVDGDITEPNLGLSEAEAARVAGEIDVLINSSGRVTFNPPLESALKTNVEGTRNVIAFAKRMRRPALIHTSTCFVAGNRSGEVWEDERLDGYFPRWRELDGTRFSVEQEIADSERIAAEVRAQADDAQVAARLRSQARARLLDESRDPDDEDALKLAVARQRKEWIRAELTRRGVERARAWGWPNIYTYTKSMGDQLVARETDMVRSIVRPAIVESAVAYPFPGWNEGFTTSAPLVYLALKGQNVLPVSKKLVLDIVPVDHVAAGMLMVAAQACVEPPKLVHQLSSGDLNPARIHRIVTLTGLYKRKRFQDKGSGNCFLNALAARMEFRPVSYDEYERTSIPLFHRVAKAASSALGTMRPRWGAGRLSEIIDRAKKGVDEVARVTDEAHQNIALFRPFILDNEYVFRADNIRSLRARLGAGEGARLHWGPELLDWYDYWTNIHFPGLQRWVLPELDETYAPKPKQVYAYHDLIELFDTTTKLHATRPALRIERGGREELHKYGELQELAGRAGCFLIAQNREEALGGQRVMLFAHNAPEWPMAYFGIIQAGGVAVPVAHESTAAEVVNLARASGAVGVLVGDDLHEKHPGLARALRDAGLAARVWPFHQLFALHDERAEQDRRKRLLRRQSPDAVASLIFTSGTTGKPKGVMLTHRNLTFMVAELSKTFDFGVKDGMLSVLPLHHTFEFSAGLLVPLARGAQVTYLPELSGDAIGRALKQGRVTAIVGVPALWELMRRRVMQRFSERSPLFELGAKAFAEANHRLRCRTGVDLGILVFLPVHEGMGGRIKYLISGGSALPADLLETFHGMGFSFMEGYGLTETAPVLTVTSPKRRPIPGSVGRPLPGVEIRIDSPDASGVGEVVARGRNVMAGYWQDEEATREVMRDGWFHTGDLGRFDAEGNLYLAGRSKEVIVDSNGKNVYPDEVEELYRDCPFIKELSVVGAPDGAAEHVACVAVPAYDHDASLGRDEVRARVEAHFRAVSASLPFWKRVKALEIWDEELPRTATRKVKRREVIAELQRRRQVSALKAGDEGARRGEGVARLVQILARVSGKPAAEIHPGTRLDQIGFDSLMHTEILAALDSAGIALPEGTDLSGASDVRQLAAMVTGRAAGERDPGPSVPRRDGREDDVAVPRVLARAGRRTLAATQRLFYERALETRVVGRAHIPANVTFIVAANHASHLDMGLVKVALGDAGRDIASLAAADYFFRDRWRRAYFANFTNLVPMERSGSIRRSLDRAEQVLRRGRSMVLFPEGTRSQTGAMAPFLPSLGYLALRAGVGILPAYVAGTFDALPKGAALPRRRRVGVSFGPFLTADDLRRLVEDLPPQEGWRLVAALCQRMVENMRDGVPNALDLARAKAGWDGERLSPSAEQREKRVERARRPLPRSSAR